MKRHGYLYDDICSMDNLREAHKRASRGKRHYREVIMVDSNPDEYLEQIREMLVKKTFKNSPYITKRESIPSYWGWFKWADSFNLINKYGVNYG